MIKRILVPTDFTPASELALQYAMKLSDPFDAVLVLLHAIEPIQGATDADWSDELYRPLRRRAQAQLDQRVSEIGSRQVEPRLLVKSRWRAIVEIAENDRCDLIVMGARSPRAEGELAPGSTSFRTFLATQTPLLIIRP